MSAQNPNHAPSNNYPITERIGDAVMDFRINHQASKVEKRAHEHALYSDLGRAALTGEQRISQIEMSARLDDFAASYGVESRNPANIAPQSQQLDSKITDRITATGIPLGEREFGASDTVDGNMALPRNRKQRVRDARIDAKGYKKSVKDTTSYRDQLIYEGTTTFGKVAHPNQLQGANKRQRRAEKRAVNKRLRKGLITAQDARVQKAAIMSPSTQPYKHGEKVYKIHNRKQRIANFFFRLSSRNSDTKLKRAASKLERLNAAYVNRFGEEPDNPDVARSLNFLRRSKDSIEGMPTRDIKMRGRLTHEPLNTVLNTDTVRSTKPKQLTLAEKAAQRNLASYDKILQSRHDRAEAQRSKAIHRRKEDEVKANKLNPGVKLNKSDAEWRHQANETLKTLGPIERSQLHVLEGEIARKQRLEADETKWDSIRLDIYQKNYGPLSTEQAAELTNVIQLLEELDNPQSAKTQPESEQTVSENNTDVESSTPDNPEDIENNHPEAYLTGLKYISGRYRKRDSNQPFSRMSPASFTNAMERLGISEEIANAVYSKLQSKGHISQIHVAGEGYQVTTGKEEFEALINALEADQDSESDD
jgi:hypothetical protein